MVKLQGSRVLVVTTAGAAFLNLDLIELFSMLSLALGLIEGQAAAS